MRTNRLFLGSALAFSSLLAAQEPPAPAASSLEAPAASSPVAPAALATEAPVVQEPTAPVRRADVPIPSDRHGDQVLEITLRDALRLGRVSNVGLKARSLAPFQLAEGVRIEDAFFEPEVFANVDYSESLPVPVNVFQAVERQQFSTALGLRQRLATGALYELSFRPVALRQNAEAFQGDQAFPSPVYTNALTLSVTQPLLRGGWIDYNLAGVNSAEAALEAGRSRFEREVQDTLIEIVIAYWELVFAREDFRVVWESMELAKEQLRITNERIRVRELAERDRVSDEADVARRRENLIRAANEIVRQEDILRELLFDDADGYMWERNLRPISPIEADFRAPDVEWRDAARTALQLRPDIAALRAEVKDAEIGVNRSANEVLPQLDLIGSYTSESLNENSSDVLSEVWGLDFPTWNVGLQFVVPLGNNAARGARDRAMLRLEAARRELYAAELAVTREVRETLRDLRTSSESILAGIESVRLAETTLDTERERLRVGRTTMFEVQQRNQELLEARQQLLRNQLDYRVSESRLLYVQGVLQAPGSDRHEDL